MIAQRDDDGRDGEELHDGAACLGAESSGTEGVVHVLVLFSVTIYSSRKTGRPARRVTSSHTVSCPVLVVRERIAADFLTFVNRKGTSK
ncbi:hypothetical protein DMH04_00050 [Kibdelosporangium aridum]|uniref:Uncharacterized protein n=1 Tax=Kibdelosporangium aridum TaxID=2030 RepID=A0A428ZTN8_KIBAR|nr:hypothetical protein DMH04_00050 [Kibdelosporangium aridum]